MKRRLQSVIRVPPTLLGVSILIGLGIRLAIAYMPGYLGDQIAWALLAKNAVTQGVSHVYALILQTPQLGVYPPLYYYLLALIGIIYQNLFSSSFVIPSFGLNFLLKLAPILGDCAIGLLLYVMVKRLTDEKRAIGAAIAFIFNPAIIYTSAYWGMFGDSIYTFLVLLSLFALYEDKLGWAWIALIAGISVKPQALVFAPLVFFVTLRKARPQGWLQIVIVSLLTFGIIWLPFVLSGTLLEALTASSRTFGLFPVLSANAHNIWYLFSKGNSWISDAMPLIGPFSAKTIGVTSLVLVYACALFAHLKTTTLGKQLYAISAYIAFAFFAVSTEMHENYLFPTVTLLVLVYWQSKFLKIFACILSVTALANMALHDVLFDPQYWLSSTTVIRLAILNSGINTMVFIIWTCCLVRGKFRSAGQSPPSGRRHSVPAGPT